MINIGSSSEFSKLLSTSSIVVADFYADWCAPCRQIAPAYEQLEKKHSKPNRITFTKVNVDNQQEISQKYGVRAMPTFMIFHNGSIINTIRGADVRGLTTAVEAAVKLAGPTTPAYASAGRTLGGTAPRAGQSLARPYNFKGVFDAIIAFIGLYLYSFFSFDAYTAAEQSPFNVNRTRDERPDLRVGKDGRRTGAATQVGKKLGTLSDLSRD